MRPCPRCRHSMDADAAFCPHCGHSMASEERRRREVATRGRRRRWLVIGGAALLLVVVALLLPEGTPPPRPSAELDLPSARRALREQDWPRVTRLLSPAGEVPAGSEARGLLARALHERCLAEGGVGYERAARVRELSLADDPQRLEGLRARAELESSFGAAQRAVSWWEAALQEAGRRGRESPEYRELLLDAAVARALVGEFGRAELLLEELLQVEPANARALTNRGLLHLEAGRLELAEADLLAALRLDSGLVPARAGLVETARRRASADRLREVAASVRLSELSSVTAHHLRALLAEEAGDLEEAARELQAARELAPRDPRLEAELARLGRRSR